MGQRKGQCAGCGGPVFGTDGTVVCQPCRKKARLLDCAWCSEPFDPLAKGTGRSKDRKCCTPGHGRAYAKFTRYGFSDFVLRTLIAEATASD